jgi:hypothetical protein
MTLGVAARGSADAFAPMTRPMTTRTISLAAFNAVLRIAPVCMVAPA